MFVCIYEYMRAYLCVKRSLGIEKYMYICIWKNSVHTKTRMCTNTNVYIYIYIVLHIIYIYIYIYILGMYIYI